MKIKVKFYYFYALWALVFTLCINISLNQTKNWGTGSWILVFVTSLLFLFSSQKIYNHFYSKTNIPLPAEKNTCNEYFQDRLKEIILKRDLKTIQNAVTEIFADNIGISYVRFFIYNKEQERFDPVISEGIERRTQPNKQLTSDHTLIKLLKKEKCPLLCDALLKNYSIDDMDKNELSEELRALGASIIVPNFTNNELSGFVSLSNKSNNSPYTTQEVDLISALANQLAFAVQNAIAYEQIKKREKIHQYKLLSLKKMISEFAHQISNPVSVIMLNNDLMKMDIDKCVNVKKENINFDKNI
ncbi:GAF domain-containing protein, partial [bacterium]